MIVEVAGQRFKSKTALLTKIREILYAYDLGAFASPEDSAFLTACLEIANEYYGYPIEKSSIRWRIQTQPVFKQREFVIYREDRTRENPSIKRLAMMKPKGPKKPKHAARHDISDQILAFRSSVFSDGFHCADPDCDHSSFDASEFEVDHIIPFSELWDAFINNMGVTENEIGVVEYRDDGGKMLSFGLAYPFDIAFKGFHQKHAKLQLLCLGCHAHKTYAGNQE